MSGREIVFKIAEIVDREEEMRAALPELLARHCEGYTVKATETDIKHGNDGIDEATYTLTGNRSDHNHALMPLLRILRAQDIAVRLTDSKEDKNTTLITVNIGGDNFYEGLRRAEAVPAIDWRERVRQEIQDRQFHGRQD